MRKNYLNPKEHFINWMQFTTTGYWSKLWARITDSMPKGNYTITIHNSN